MLSLLHGTLSLASCYDVGLKSKGSKHADTQAACPKAKMRLLPLIGVLTHACLDKKEEEPQGIIMSVGQKEGNLQIVDTKKT